MSMSGLLQDDTQVQLKSLGLQKYVTASGGGGGNVTVNQDVASTWETFKVCSLPIVVTA
jgi:DNA primase